MEGTDLARADLRQGYTPHQVSPAITIQIDCRYIILRLTTADEWHGRIYELAGDEAYTLAELAAELSRQADRPVGYQNLPEADYHAALVGAGLPAALAALLADSDVGAAKGALFDASRQLSALLGRPTRPLTASVAATLDRQ